MTDQITILEADLTLLAENQLSRRTLEQAIYELRSEIADMKDEADE